MTWHNPVRDSREQKQLLKAYKLGCSTARFWVLTAAEALHSTFCMLLSPSYKHNLLEKLACSSNCQAAAAKAALK